MVFLLLPLLVLDSISLLFRQLEGVVLNDEFDFPAIFLGQTDIEVSDGVSVLVSRVFLRSPLVQTVDIAPAERKGFAEEGLVNVGHLGAEGRIHEHHVALFSLVGSHVAENHLRLLVARVLGSFHKGVYPVLCLEHTGVVDVDRSDGAIAQVEETTSEHAGAAA